MKSSYDLTINDAIGHPSLDVEQIKNKPEIAIYFSNYLNCPQQKATLASIACVARERMKLEYEGVKKTINCVCFFFISFEI